MNPSRPDAAEAPDAGTEGYRRLVDLSPDACFIVVDRRIEYANAAGIALLGASRPGEVFGRAPEEFVPPELRDAARAAIDAMAHAGTPIPPDWTLQRLDGSKIEIEVSSNAFELRGRRAIGAVVRDVTERRRVERALKRSEERLAAFLRNVPCAAFIKDAEGRYVLVNDQLASVRDIPVEGWIGRTDAEILPPETAALLRRNDEHALETGGTLQTVEETPHPDGMRQWLVTRFAIPGPGGARMLGGIGFDITSRVRAEEERAWLVDAERAARTSAEDAVRRLESIQQVTDAALAHLGLDALLEELLARIRRLLDADASTILLASEDGKALTVRASDGFPAGSQTSIPMGTGVAAEIAARRAPVVVDRMNTTDGMRFVLSEPLRSLLGVPLLVEGRVIGVLKVGTARTRLFSEDESKILQVVADRIAPAIDRARLHDALLVERKRLETVSRRLLEVQETERRHVARELHDEVGQLVTSLKLRLESGDAGRHGSETREIVNDLMARVRDLSMNLMPPMLDDLGLLPALMWHVERYTAQTRVRVIFRHAGIDRRFRRDIELAAYRIAQEGLTNVARHTSVARVKLEVWASSDSLGVEVNDDGPGFDVEAATSGPSLGLPGMRERVRLVGGQLTVDSSPGAGTRLCAVLPLATPAARA